MIAQRRGKIINIASVAGLRGSSPKFSAIGYSASKGGVIIFTEGPGLQMGHANIQVNAIAPGCSPPTCRKRSSSEIRNPCSQVYLWPLRRAAGSEGSRYFSRLRCFRFCDRNTLLLSMEVNLPDPGEAHYEHSAHPLAFPSLTRSSNIRAELRWSAIRRTLLRAIRRPRRRLAGALHKAGVQRGDRVAFLSSNCHACSKPTTACWKPVPFCSR